MKLPDNTLDNVHKAIDLLTKRLHKETGKPFFISWGMKNEEEDVEGFALEGDMNWGDICRILVALNSHVSEKFDDMACKCGCLQCELCEG